MKYKLADLVGLDQNLLENIRQSESVSLIMLNGRLYEAKTLPGIYHPQSDDVPDAAPRGQACGTLIVSADGRVLDVRFKDGDEALRSLDESIREIRQDVEFPPDSPPCLALTLYVACVRYPRLAP